jgi:nitroimidazol reductase NimA-like FMN-containing flavoprotein (pyridoxamine 5'-phosphate oxidase superfamily)
MVVPRLPSAVAERPLSPSPRTKVNRGSARARTDRQDLYDVLGAAMICHLGLVVDGSPRVLPTAFGVDLGGPDSGGTIYLHGSVASRSLRDAPHLDVCVTLTVLDGLVLARSAFHHSMNYRSAVIFGRPRVVDDVTERLRALDLIVDHVVPGRAATLRPHTRKELAATTVLALGLAEASVKVRTGDPVDDECDLGGDEWAGVIPLKVVAGDPVTAADAAGTAPPDHVRERAASLVR